jgi:hypothetical protein
MRLALNVFGAAAILAAGQTAQAGPMAAAAQAAPPPAAAAPVTMLRRVCLPLIQGGDLKSVAKSAGLKQVNGQWILRIDHRRRLELDPPDDANPHVCGATIIHGVGAQPAIRRAIDTWARARLIPLDPVKVEQPSTDLNYELTTSTWAGKTPKGAIGVALSAEKTLQGRPVGGDVGQSKLFASFTPNAT